MRRLQQIFKDVPIGSQCTGTVHMYKLDVKKLTKQKVIEQRSHKVSLGDGKVSQLVNDYFFLGISEENFRTPKRDEQKDEEEQEE